MTRKYFLLLLVVAFVLITFIKANQVDEVTLVKPYPMINFNLPDLTGKQVNSHDWADKIIIINFWATWCPPCRKEIPELIEIQNQFGSQGVQIIGITIDKLGLTKKFSEAFKINYPLLMAEEKGMALSLKYGNHIGGLPYSVVINKGEVVIQHSGELTYSAIAPHIRTLLRTKK